MKRVPRKLLRILLWSTSIFFILLILFLIFTQTAPFRSLVTRIIIEQSGNFLNGELLIGEVTGNFYNRITIRDIIVLDGEKQVLSLAELTLQYQLRPLLRKKFVVSEVLLNDLDVFLTEEETGWNWERILNLPAPDEISETDDPSAKEKKEFGWDFSVDKISLRDFDIYIQTISTTEKLIPSSINDLNLLCTFSRVGDQLRIELQEAGLQFNWHDAYSLSIEQISFLAVMKNEVITLENFLLQSGNFELTANANTDLSLTNLAASLDLNVSNSADLAYFLPDINPDNSMGLRANLTGGEERLDLQVKIIQGTGGFDLQASLINPPYLGLEAETEISANLVFKEFNPTAWLADETFYALINGGIDLSGNSLNYLTGSYTVNIDLSHSVIHLSELVDDHILIREFKTALLLEKSKLQGDLILLTDEFGYLVIDAQIGNIEDMSDFEIQGEIENLDLSALKVMKDHPTDLNLTFTVNGKGLEERPLYVLLKLLPSQYAGLPIDQILLRAELLEEGIQVDTLHLHFLDNTLQIKGYLSLTGENEAEYVLDLENLRPILAWVDSLASDPNAAAGSTETPGLAEMFETRGTLNGRISGLLKELSVSGLLELQDFRYDEIQCAEIVNSFTITRDEEFLLVQMFMELARITAGNFQIDNVTLAGDLAREKISIELEIDQSEQLSLVLDADVYQNDDFDIVLKRLDIRYLEDLWQVAQDGASLIFDGESFTISDFRLENREQSIEAGGIVSLESDNDFRLLIEQFDLAPLIDLLDDPPVLSGILALDLTLGGLLSDPEISATIELSQISTQDLPDLAVMTYIQFLSSTEILQADLSLQLAGEPYVDVVLYLPVSYSPEEGVNLYKERNFYINLRTVDIALSIFDALLEEVRGLNGTMQAELTLGNTLDDIRAIGSVEITNTEFAFPVLNTRYRNFNLLLELNNNRFDLVNLAIDANQGKLHGNGYMTIGKDLVDGANGLLEDDLTLFNLQINTDNFQLINTAALDFLINSRILIEGSPDHPRFTGRVSINRGRIDIDRLIGDMLTENTAKPLLVHTREQQVLFMDLVDPTSPFEKFQLQNLRGDFSISIPRNTWIRSSDMNVEVSGDLDIIADGTNFEIFGNLSTLRGYYVFFGKRFLLEMGEVTFSGGRDFNPQVELQAIYSFRGLDSTRNNLRLKLTGSLEQMNIAFELNDQPVEEADAVSYILFGRSFDELTQGEKSEAQNQALAVGGFLANRLTDQLSSVVGDSFRLDLIEFRSDTARSEIGLEVGKYLTDKLFVSYKRDFSFDKTQDQVFEEILLEYEITRFLYLQASRRESNDFGVDLIWRYKWR